MCSDTGKRHNQEQCTTELLQYQPGQRKISCRVMVHEQLLVIISTLIKDSMYLQEQCRAKKSLALDIFYTNVTIHTDQIIWSEQLISKLSCILLSHNEPGMYASTVIQDNRH